MILSLIAICFVFGCLLILFVIYSILGGFFSGKIKLPGRHDDSHAAAVATDESEIAAVIAMALRLCGNSGTHDAEPGIITIQNNPDSHWNDKSLTFRKSPRK